MVVPSPITFGGTSIGPTNSGNIPVYSDGVTVSAGRAMANGSTSVLITHIRASSVGGFGGPISVALRLGNAQTGYVGVASGATNDTGYVACSPVLTPPATGYLFTIYSTGHIQFMRGGGTGTTYDQTGAFSGASIIAGGYMYVQAPSAPTIAVSGGVVAGTARVSITAPTDDGGSAITGYSIQYADNGSFTGASTTIVTGGGPHTIPGLTTGKTWYFRVGARNAVTTAASTTSVYSSTSSVFLANPTNEGNIIVSYGIAALADGSAYASDQNNNVVNYYDSAGNYILRWGSAGSGDGQFSGPSGVETDASGNVYVADTGNNRIQKFDASGSYTTKWGTTGSGNTNMNTPYDIAISGSNVYLSDSGNNRVVRYNLSGTYQAQWGTAGSGNNNLSAPRGIAVDASGNVYVADYGNNRVIKRNSAGTYQAQYTGFNQPQDVAVDSLGNIWVSDTANNQIVKLDSAGALLKNIPIFPQPLMLDIVGDLLYVTLNNLGTESDKVVVLSINGPKLSDAFSYYIGLCTGQLSLDYQASEDPVVTLVPFNGNVWDHLKQLCAAYGVEAALVGTTIQVRDLGTTVLDITNVVGGSASLTLTSRDTGRSVEFKNYNAVSGGGVAFESSNVYQVDVLGLQEVTIQNDNYLLSISDPEPVDTYDGLPGTYFVIDSTGAHVPVADWNYSGASIRADIDPTQPGYISLTITGPVAAITGYTGPFYFATIASGVKASALTVTGFGVFTAPSTVKVYSGADFEHTSRDVAFSVDNFAHYDKRMIYRRATWSTSRASGPAIELNCSVPTPQLDGFGLTTGSLIQFKESQYRVIKCEVGRASTRITAARYVTVGELDALWSGETVGDFDALWNGYEVEDFKVKTLRH